MMKLAGRRAIFGIGLATVSLAACGPSGRNEDNPSVEVQRSLCAAGLVRRGDACEAPLWAEIAPLPSHARRMLDVANVDGREAWIVGKGGLVLHGRDGGEHFERVDAGTGEDLLGVWADERAIVLTAARRGIVSWDRGRTFVHSPEASEDLTRCVLFFGNVVCGSAQGGIHRWKSGEATFARISQGGPGRTVVQVGPGYLVAATATASGTRIRATQEPDLHAFHGDAEVPGEYVDSLWVSRRGLLACMMADDPSDTHAEVLHCSTTRGRSFEARGSISPECARGPRIDGSPEAIHVMTYCNTVDMPVTFEVSTSRDGGRSFTKGTWGAEFESSWRAANRMSFGTPDHGLFLTHRLRRTTDGARTSEPIEKNALSADWSGGLNENNAVLFPTATRGYVIAMQNTTAVFRYRLYRTDDGLPFDEGKDLPSFTSGSTRAPRLAAIGDRLWLAHPSDDAAQSFLRSEDGGRTFLPDGFPAQGQPIAAIALGPEGLGFVAPAREAVNTRPLYRSTNGGATFDEVLFPNGTYLREMRFLHTARFVAVGEHGVVLTSDDAGQSFVDRRGVNPEETLLTVHFAPGSLVGWAGGVTNAGQPILLHTEDGGETWNTQTLAGSPDGTIVQVAAATPSRASVVLESTSGARSLRMTQDGGQSWSLREAPAGDELREVARIEDGETTFALSKLGLYRSATP